MRIANRDQVRCLQEQGATIVEVLPAEEYALEHIAGAVNLPLKKLDRSVVDRFPTARPIVVYCHDSL